MKNIPLLDAAVVSLERLEGKIGREAVMKHFPELVGAVVSAMKPPVPYNGSKIGFLAEVA